MERKFDHFTSQQHIQIPTALADLARGKVLVHVMIGIVLEPGKHANVDDISKHFADADLVGAPLVDGGNAGEIILPVNPELNVVHAIVMEVTATKFGE